MVLLLARSVVLVALPALLLGAGCHLIFPFEHDALSPDQALVEPDAGGDLALDTTPSDAPPDAPPPDAPPPDAPPDMILPSEAILPPDVSLPDAALTDALQPDLGLGSPCANDSDCATGHCIGSLCCDTACSSTCRSCNLPGKQGTCSPLPSGTTCPSTCSGNSVESRACDSVGVCQSKAATSCGNYLCKAGACLTGCATHADCHPGSLTSGLCDRRQAHVSGQGDCLDPKVVVEATVGGSISGAVSAALTSSGKSAVLVPKTTYKEQVAFNSAGKSLLIAGDDSIISSPNSASPAVMVIGGELSLQGLILTHTSSGSGDGAACLGGTLRIFESTLKDNSGAGAVVAPTCTFELRRSTVTNNAAGGLDLSGGKYKANSTVVNSLIVVNGMAGASGSQFGGISLTWHGLPLPTLYNNTLVNNVASTGAKAGVVCNTTLTPGQSYTLINSVVWFNNPIGATTGCAFQYSIMKGLANSMGNLNANPTLDAAYHPIAPSPCIDTGTSTASVTVLDRANNPRPKLSSGKVDKGAFEVQ